MRPISSTPRSKSQLSQDMDHLRKNDLIGEVRLVKLKRNGSNEGLGISITGGREHGVPILISEVHDDGLASRSGELYVGDAILSVNGIDLKEALHSQAVETLSNLVRALYRCENVGGEVSCMFLNRLERLCLKCCLQAMKTASPSQLTTRIWMMRVA
jgi:hypothetical protein